MLLSALDRLARAGRGRRHWLPAFWERARKGAKVTDSPWKILDEVTAASGGLGAAFEQAMVDTILAEPANRVVCQILEEFGPPAATVVNGGTPSAAIRLPPLSGHIFQFPPTKTGREVSIRVQAAAADLKNLKVRAWKFVPGKAAAAAEVKLRFQEPAADRAEWRTKLKPREPLTAMVCHAGIAGGAAQVEAASS